MCKVDLTADLAQTHRRATPGAGGRRSSKAGGAGRGAASGLAPAPGAPARRASPPTIGRIRSRSRGQGARARPWHVHDGALGPGRSEQGKASAAIAAGAGRATPPAAAASASLSSLTEQSGKTQDAAARANPSRRTPPRSRRRFRRSALWRSRARRPGGRGRRRREGPGRNREIALRHLDVGGDALPHDLQPAPCSQKARSMIASATAPRRGQGQHAERPYDTGLTSTCDMRFGPPSEYDKYQCFTSPARKGRTRWMKSVQRGRARASTRTERTTAGRLSTRAVQRQRLVEVALQRIVARVSRVRLVARPMQCPQRRINPGVDAGSRRPKSQERCHAEMEVVDESV